MIPHFLPVVQNLCFRKVPGPSILVKVHPTPPSPSQYQSSLLRCFFSVSFLSSSNSILISLVVLTTSLPSVECQLHKGREFEMFCSLVYLRWQGPCLRHSRCSVNACWMKQWERKPDSRAFWGLWRGPPCVLMILTWLSWKLRCLLSFQHFVLSCLQVTWPHLYAFVEWNLGQNWLGGSHFHHYFEMNVWWPDFPTCFF